MRQPIFALIITSLFITTGGVMAKASETATIYSFKAKKIEGQEVSLADYKGKALLIVNTASKCGFTPQYGALQELYDAYKDRGFQILAFPANNFGGQEPGTNEEIKKFCDLRFKVKFDLFEKVSVKGKGKDPLFKYLTEESSQKGEILWNFEKFLISPEGEVVARFRSATKPQSDKLIRQLESILPS